jgi:hypothetical protein
MQYLIAHGIARTVYAPSLENPDVKIDIEKIQEVIERGRQIQVWEWFYKCIYL